MAIDNSGSENNKIVGIQCAIPLEFTDVKGNVQLSAKSEDTLVDPAYRGQKIFERMYDDRRNGCLSRPKLQFCVLSSMLGKKLPNG